MPLKNDVIALLQALGVATPESNHLLDFVIHSVETKLMNMTNQHEIPAELDPLAVRMAAGEYLSYMKGSGQLEGFELDEAAIKSIQEGDTNTAFAVGEGSQTPEQRLDVLINCLTTVPACEINRFRRLVW
jgi:hypothetical protein